MIEILVELLINLQCTKNTAILNAIDLDTVQCDLIVALSDRLRGIVDLLLFNPPYVPTVTTGNDNIVCTLRSFFSLFNK